MRLPRRSWSQLTTAGVGRTSSKLRELPVSNPAELAEYAADNDAGDVSDVDHGYIDLNPVADDAATAVDELGYAGPDDQVDLDAA